MRLAGALLDETKVDVLAGGFLSNVGLAMSDVAKQRKRLFVASEPLTDALVWEQGHRYCYRLRPSTYMQVAMMVDDAVKLGAKRWVTVSPNYEYGQSLVKWFKLLMAQRLLQRSEHSFETCAASTNAINIAWRAPHANAETSVHHCLCRQTSNRCSTG